MMSAHSVPIFGPAQPSHMIRRNGRYGQLLGVIFAISLPMTLAVAEAGRLLAAPRSAAPALARGILESDMLPAGLSWLSQPSPDGKPAHRLRWLFPGQSPLIDLAAEQGPQDWRAIVASLFPPEMLSGWIEVTLKGVSAWFESDRAVPQVTYDLTGLKARILSTHGLEALRTAYAALPKCDGVEAERDPTTDRAGQRACAPPGPASQAGIDALAQEMPRAVGGIRDQFTMEQALTPIGLGDARADFAPTKLWLLRLRQWAWTAPLLPLLCLFSILLVEVRSWSELAGSWARWLVAGGGLTLIVSASLGLTVRNMPEALLAGNLTPDLVAALSRAATVVASQALIPLGIRGGAAILLGLVLWMWRRQSAVAGGSDSLIDTDEADGTLPADLEAVPYAGQI